MSTSYAGGGGSAATANAELVARLERIPVTRRLLLIRIIIGSATFFDAYTVLVIAFAMPQLVKLWNLSPADVGLILSAGYVGQLFGAIGFGWLAERIGRDGKTTPNERALLMFLKTESASIDPALKALLDKAAV